MAHSSIKPPKARSHLAGAIYETAAGLHRIGLLDKATMREVDVSCLTPVEPLSPRQIAALRRREGVSQGVLAHYLNVRPKPVKRVGARRKEAERPLVETTHDHQGARDRPHRMIDASTSIGGDAPIGAIDCW